MNAAVCDFAGRSLAWRGLPTPSVVRVYDESRPLELESGQTLAPVDVAYHTYGRLNPEGSNAVLVCHAMTGDAYVARPDGADCPPGWWQDLFGPGAPLDSRKYFIICSNILGSCYGTTGPSSLHPITGRPFGPDFPAVGIRDMVRVQKALLDHLGVRQLALAIGGSLGGMQVLEWALLFPERVRAIATIATAVRHSDWAIGLNEAARLAITSDPEWLGGRYREQPKRGLALARMMAMLSYRHYDSYNQNFDRSADAGEKAFDDPFEGKRRFAVESYLRYQGQKLVNRFDANCYLTISRAMDAHDITRGRGCLRTTLARIKVPALSVGISSDLLYPDADQRNLADLLPRGRYARINSIHGHDAFLIEFDQMQNILGEFLKELEHAA
ncbi:homoserine O-acetyltransferase MetX [Acanthopleuribacter pedis]|uniref:Homoserine O-acetyltransferase n=1 Tax=Acanthopleuribacter pedis TaxID=442870 RepID=A0A8J7U406_9BACT|nr:homoserine O-acetyltransferase [Acanthopleuribacter pedis]MBO1318868.1 homoserine O-acetyltransferase [Acanthopleuribacter pedis]